MIVVNVLGILLLKVTLFWCQSGACENGWFGDKCQYLCHCAGSVQCEDDGSCTAGCDDKWFGPACQYHSIAYTVKNTMDTMDFNWLRDKDDTTCNGGDDVWLTITLEEEIYLSWIRLTVDNPAYLYSIEVFSNMDARSEPCKQNQRASVGITTLDISCPTSELTQEVSFLGEGVSHLCSLYISGGRNVALKQATSQSSRFITESAIPEFRSSFAVDGRVGTTDADSTRGTCSHTGHQVGPSWWELQFSKEVDITRIIIHNRLDCCQERLANFRLTATSSSKEKGVYMEQIRRPIQAVYNVVPSPKLDFPVSTIRIDLNDTNGVNYLTLCEVFVFGDSHCPPGRYGLECDRECNCADKQENCLVHSGGCTSGCALGHSGVNCAECDNGFYGNGCAKRCSELCGGDRNMCHHVSGECVHGCDTGYQGATCTQVCDIGHFGEGCRENCSEHCAGDRDACHHASGKCDLGCESGYKGSLCSEVCDVGLYGVGCREVCSEHCAGDRNSCHHISGECVLGCDPGYTGSYCSHECDIGFYGDKCEEMCSEHCRGERRLCHHVSGKCDQGCEPGYRGSFCTQVCSGNKYGVNCENTCSGHCIGDDNVCNHVNGSCNFGCKVGYQPPLCDDKCSAGQYGSDCAQACSVKCSGPTNLCDSVTGECVLGCDVGYLPPTCHTECSPARYGQDCNMTCSVHCAGDDHACDSATGVCDQGCEPGYHGDFCSETCPRGRHGLDCNQTCSAQCAGRHKPCNHVDGTCYLGCVPGDQSQLCHRRRNRPISYNDWLQDKHESNHIRWAIVATAVAVTVAVVAIFIITILLWRYQNLSQAKTQMQSNKDPNNASDLELRGIARPRNDENHEVTSGTTVSTQVPEPSENEMQYTKLYDRMSNYYASPEYLPRKESKTYDEPTPFLKSENNHAKNFPDSGAYAVPATLTRTAKRNESNSQYVGVYEELSPFATVAENPSNVFEYSKVYEQPLPQTTTIKIGRGKDRTSGTYKNIDATAPNHVNNDQEYNVRVSGTYNNLIVKNDGCYKDTVLAKDETKSET